MGFLIRSNLLTTTEPMVDLELTYCGPTVLGRRELLLSPSYGQQRVTLGVDGQHRVNRTYVPDSTPLTPLNKGLKGNSKFRLYDDKVRTGDAPEEEGNALRI